MFKNQLSQVVGFPLGDFSTPEWPPSTPIKGHYCRIEPLNMTRHARQLFDAYSADTEHRNWTYLPYGPFAIFDDYQNWMRKTCFNRDPFFHAVIDVGTGRAVGVASYLRIVPNNASIEVGHINFSPALQQTVASTESMYLLMRRVFELGYRRYEWKCDALNDPSNRAAKRLGFSYEGLFRQATHYKGRNRDTAWYSIIDKEWPALQRAFQRWFDADNFDARGNQRHALSALTSMALESVQPSPTTTVFRHRSEVI